MGCGPLASEEFVRSHWYRQKTHPEGVPHLPPINTRGTDLLSPIGSNFPIKGEAPA